MLLLIKQWRIYACEHPAKAAVVGGIPFVLLMLLGNYNSYVVDGESSGGALLGAIICLYLALALFMGLTTPFRVGCIGPVLAYAALVLLWPLISGDSYDSFTYDSGWVGGIIYQVVIPCFVIWLVVLTGYSIGHPTDKR